MSQAFRDLFNLLGRYKWPYIISGLLLILSIVFRTFEPKILQIAVDHVIVLKDKGEAMIEGEPDLITSWFLRVLPDMQAENIGMLLLALAMLYVAIALIRGAALFVSESMKAWVSETVAKNLRDQTFSHIQRLPLQYFTRMTRGELIQRCTGDIDTIKGFLKSHVITLIRILAIFTFSFLMMALADLTFALICISLTPLIGITSWWFFKKERKVWKEHEEESDRLNNMVQENLNGIRLVAAFANEQHEIEQFRKQNERKRAIAFRHSQLHALFWPLSDYLGFSQIVLSIVVGGYFAIHGRITVGELLSFITYIGMVAWPMRQLGRLLSQIGMAVVAMERISEILNASREHSLGLEKGKLHGAISFRHVYFRYMEGQDYALKDINLSIKAGEKVAIIGPTGSGKSTLVKLLMRLYEPTKGEIWLDGKQLQAWSRQYLREQIGLALQKPFLFSQTIYTNIAYASPQASGTIIKQAAETAKVEELEDLFEEGFETMVGEKGVTLSGGQKQRIALARTLLPNPDILVLDDITSAVDTETEQAIFDALRGPLTNKTTLIISHRITSIQQADRILVMGNGQIVQEGTPEELAEVVGYYQEIHRIQSELEQQISVGTTRKSSQKPEVPSND